MILISLLLYREVDNSKMCVLVLWKQNRVDMEESQQPVVNIAVMLTEIWTRE